MDEDPPPPTDHGTPEETVPSTGGAGSHDAVTAHGAAGADSGVESASGGGNSGHFLDQLHNLSSFDTGCLLVICLSLFWGLVRGGSRELSAILVWVGAFWVSVRTSDAALAWADPSLPESLQDSNLAHWGAKIIVFVIAVVIFSTMADRVAYIAKSNLSRSLDTLLGFVFGAVRGYALIVVFCLVSSWASTNWLASLTQGSITMPYIVKGMKLLQGYVPSALQSYLALPDTNTLQDTNSQ